MAELLFIWAMKRSIKSLKNKAVRSKTRSKMREKYPQDYDYCVRHKLLDRVFRSVQNNGYSLKRVPNGTWTYSACKEISDCCETRAEFRKFYPSVSAIASKNGWMNSLFEHHPNCGLSERQVKCGHWDLKTNVMNVAKKCKSRSEFHGFRGAYEGAKRNNWYYEIERLLPVKGNSINRSIYAIENLKSNTVYIGLSFDPTHRFYKHQTEGRKAVKELIKSGGKLKILEENLPKAAAARMEAKYVEQYTREGWKLVNEAKPGALGGNWRLYDKWDCHFFASWCESRGEMGKFFPYVYSAARKLGIIDEIFSKHPNKGYKIRKFGTLDFNELKRLSANYKTRSNFQKADPSAYATALTKGVMDKLFEDKPNRGFSESWQSRGKYNLDSLAEIANTCKTRGEFYRKFPKHYDAANRMGLINKLFASHDNIGFANTPRGTYTIEKVYEVAQKCKTRTILQRRYPGAYNVALSNGIIDSLFENHSNKGYARRPDGFWTVENSIDTAKRFSKRSELKKKYWSAWNVLKTEGLLEELFPKKP